MKIKWIELDNIRSYVKERIEFPEGSILLAGDVGSGKSTILYALEFALFGIQRGGFDGNYMLRHGSNQGTITMCCEIDGKDVIVFRSLRRDKKGNVTQNEGWIQINGTRNSLTSTDMRAKILEMLGYPQEYIAKNPVLFRYTVYTPQDDMKRILVIDAFERMGILRRTLGIDKYGRIKENAEAILKEMRARRRELIALTSDLESKKGDLRKRQEEVERIGEKIQNISSQHKDAERERKMYENIVGDIEKRLDSFRKLKERLASLDTTIRHLTARIFQIDAEISHCTMEAEIKEKSLGALPEKPTEKSLAEINVERRSWEQIKGKSLAEKSVLEADAKKLKAILDSGICETCRQPVIDRDKFSKDIEKIYNECNKLLLQAKEAEKKIEEFERLSSLLIEYQRKIDERKSCESEIKHMKERCIELAAQKSRIEDEKKSAEQERELLYADIEKIPSLENEFREAKNNLNTTREREYSLGRELARLESIAGSLTREIVNLQKEISEKEKLLEQVERIDRMSSWIEQIFIPFVGDAEKAIMLKVQESFNDMFQSWYSVLMGNETLTVGINEEFSPVIEQNGYLTEYERLSGGEKTSIALAYRLALNKVINNFVETIRTKEMIILDEPTDGFSTEQIDRIRNVLNELNLGQMIIVSHDPKIETFVDHIIRLSKENHVSRVVR